MTADGTSGGTPGGGTARDDGTAARAGAALDGLLDGLVDVVVDGSGPVPSVTAEVARLRRAGRAGTAPRDLARTAVVLAATGGFLTGAGTVLLAPVAVPANVAGFYATALRFVATLAELRGHDTTDPVVRRAVVDVVLTGADDAPGQPPLAGGAGLAGGPGPSRSVLAAAPPVVRALVGKAVGFRAVGSLVRSGARTGSRYLPLVGGAVGAGVDGWQMHRMTRAADLAFPPGEVLPGPGAGTLGTGTESGEQDGADSAGPADQGG